MNSPADRPAKRTRDSAVAAAWWYCLLATFTYGLVPRRRVTADALALAQALRNLPRAEREEGAVILRLDGSVGAFRHLGAPEQPTFAAERNNNQSPSTIRQPEPTQATTIGVAWGEAGEAIDSVRQLAPDLQWLSAGCAVDVAVDDTLLAELAAQQQPVTMYIADSEPPVHEVLAFIRHLIQLIPAVTVQMIHDDGTTWRRTQLNEHWQAIRDDIPGLLVPDDDQRCRHG